MNVRGRGLKINGASQRPLSRNKQWIASGQEGSQLMAGNAERGGGPRRGTGRGLGLANGSGHSTPHLTVPTLHHEAASGAEDEGMTDMEDAEVEPEVEEKDPDTPEERERFYQEVCTYFSDQLWDSLCFISWSKLATKSVRRPSPKAGWMTR